MNDQPSPQGVVPGSIPLFAGHPAPELLPLADARNIMQDLLARPDAARMFNYGDERGNPQLIDFLLQRLLHSEGLSLAQANLMIIGGSTWGLDMIARHLTSPGDAILVDAPSYRDALHIFRDAGLDARAIPVDDGGVIIDEMEKILRRLAAQNRRPKFYYVVPNFQNPTGITLSIERRQAIIDLSQRHGFAIIEDDVYRDIRFHADLPPSFYALSPDENVLRLGTFSKTLAPGLRVGYLLASAPNIQRFVSSGMLSMGGGANPFTAAIVAEFCHSGLWETHLDWLREQYRQRRDCAAQALRDSMPPSTRWNAPDGGYFIWLRLPSSVHVDELESLAKRHNIYFASGKDFFVDPAAGHHHLRLSFSYLPLPDLRRGIVTLGQLISHLQSA